MNGMATVSHQLENGSIIRSLTAKTALKRRLDFWDRLVARLVEGRKKFEGTAIIISYYGLNES